MLTTELLVILGGLVLGYVVVRALMGAASRRAGQGPPRE
jgi:hypothetical protein